MSRPQKIDRLFLCRIVNAQCHTRTVTPEDQHPISFHNFLTVNKKVFGGIKKPSHI